MQPAITRQFRRQHGLITRAQAHECGLSDRQIASLVRRELWVAVAAGVYALAGSPNTWKQKVMAACLVAGPDAVASHATAAHLYGLSAARRPERIELLVPRSVSHGNRLAKVHRTLALPKIDTATVDRLPVTRPARTLIDYASVASERALEEAVDDAIIRRMVTLERLRKRHADLRGSGRPGSALLDAVLATWSDDMPQEVAEMRLLRRLARWLSLRPVAQFEIFNGSGAFVARPDLSFPEQRCGYELVSFRWHRSPRATRRDRGRSNRLKALGWRIFDAAPEDLYGDGRELAALAAPFVGWKSTREVQEQPMNGGSRPSRRNAGEEGRRSA